MNINDLENTLRCAPVPKPPGGLKQQLVDQLRVPRSLAAMPLRTLPPGPLGWLRRWWPVLAPGAASVACAVVLGVQHAQISEMQKSVGLLAETSAASMGAVEPASAVIADNAQPANAIEDELTRLKELIARLSAEITDLRRLAQENDSLRAQLAGLAPGFTAEERAALASAQEKAKAIICLNNIKQIGLAAHIWATDHNDVFPLDFASMSSSSLSAPVVLWCPADTGRVAAADWASFTAANCSYEYLIPNEPSGKEHNRVMFRCPIHGSVGLADGSAHMSVAKTNPERLVIEDGKLFLQQPQTRKVAPEEPQFE